MDGSSPWHLRRVAAFLVVGGLGFVVDATVFNALVYWSGRGPLFDLPLVAKVIAIAIATVGTYFGSKWLTYRDRSNQKLATSFLRFVVVNVAAIFLQLSCLAFSRYVLGLADQVADNLWGTVIGQALAMTFRYFAYSRWVFPDTRSTSPAAG